MPMTTLGWRKGADLPLHPQFLLFFSTFFNTLNFSFFKNFFFAIASFFAFASSSLGFLYVPSLTTESILC